MLLEQLLNADLRGDVVAESFNSTSLYTIVSNEAAFEATYELLRDHECILRLWSGVYYEQIRGLAMAQRIAPALAIAYMSKVEEPILNHRPVLYTRYTDD
ncbi:unnamed protein product [Haemonchus placei]|uniref:Reverse transcriptase domain-containing protein n=1 Tax=Haemonchus placei TaxID=6290 RepID=A0A0N4WNM6_HAEPC|nr:unnamed protein product [Haemonchus placei]